MQQTVEVDIEGFSDAELSLLGYPPRQAKSPPGQPPRKVGRPASVNLPRGNGANPVLLAEKTRLATEQADKIALANAKARGELVSAAAVETTWASILRDLRSGLLALSTRLQQRAPHLTVHDLQLVDREIRDLLTEMGTAPAAGAVDVQTDPEGTDDAD